MNILLIFLVFRNRPKKHPVLVQIDEILTMW